MGSAASVENVADDELVQSFVKYYEQDPKKMEWVIAEGKKRVEGQAAVVPPGPPMEKFSVKNDSKAGPLFLAELATMGSDVASPPLPMDSSASKEQLLGLMAAFEGGMTGMLQAATDAMEPVDNVVKSTVTITGADQNEIKLFIHKPTSDPEGAALPCVYQIHGGGMAILTASDAASSRWRDEIAALGAVVVGVDFRNSAGVNGPHPYPAGLNDCIVCFRKQGQPRCVHCHRQR